MNVESHVAELERDGYTVIPDALSPQEVRATRQAVKDLLAEERDVALGTGTQSDNLLTSHTIVGKHPEFYEFFLYPPTKLVVRQTIGANALLPHAAFTLTTFEPLHYNCPWCPLLPPFKPSSRTFS
jgi:hypothetical protein